MDGFSRTLGCVLFASLLQGCAGDGRLEPSVSGQIVGDDERPLGPGLVLIEKGPLHDGQYQVGGLIDKQGHFSISLTGGGEWGLHLFHDDYTYLPVPLLIEDYQQVALTSLNVAWGSWMELTGEPTWPDQPADTRLIRMPTDDDMADNPTFTNIEMVYLDETTLRIEGDAYDPKDALSRMVLVHDESTGGGWALNPPGPPDDRGNFPNGRYSLVVFLDERHEPGVSKWYFVVSNNNCQNSPIIEMTLPPR